MNKKILILCSILSLSLIFSACNKNNDTETTSNAIEDKTVATADSNVKDVKIEEKDINANVEKNTEKKVDSNKNNVTEKKVNNETKDINTNEKALSSSNKLSTEEKSWFYLIKTDGTPSGEPKDVLTLINKHSSYYLGDTSDKIIYLTFDEGYENGYSSKILDILKKNNVKAAFFVTTPYINSNKELVKRMVAEGHLVCNHSTTHPSMASVAIKSKDKFNHEILTTEKTFENLTGTKMPKFFRPPMGKYSELSLDYTNQLGYKTIFWSFAYADWDPDKQPTHEAAKKVILDRTHPGGIYLLHAVSKTNTEILDWLINEWRSKGFKFKTLNDLPEK